MKLHKSISATFTTLENIIHTNYSLFCILLLSANLALSHFIIRKVPYTEIDWQAYMQEVSGVLNDHQFDYFYLQGDTGPLVYPAGFVYIFSALYYLTDHGRDVRTAQYIFALLHSALLVTLLSIYRICYLHLARSKQRQFPICIVVFLFLSRRVTSLFVLRLFNDGVQMLFMYLAVLMFMNNAWSLGCFLFSISVSIKMNALLFAPAVAVLLCQARGFAGALRRIFGICLTTQLVLGTPFLVHAPVSYLSRAFELTRQFLYKWSVNGAFLEETVFLNKKLAAALLALHLTALLMFGHFKWTPRTSRGLIGLLHLDKFGKARWMLHLFSDVKQQNINPSHVLDLLFVSNFIGICFARTLHYQFYLWYAHALPFLAFRTNLPLILKVAIPFTIEIVFNVYPPHPLAAVGLHLSHFVLLASLWRMPRATNESIYASTLKSKTGKDT